MLSFSLTRTLVKCYINNFSQFNLLFFYFEETQNPCRTTKKKFLFSFLQMIIIHTKIFNFFKNIIVDYFFSFQKVWRSCAIKVKWLKWFWDEVTMHLSMRKNVVGSILGLLFDKYEKLFEERETGARLVTFKAWNLRIFIIIFELLNENLCERQLRLGSVTTACCWVMSL